jgi:alpha-glucosidase
MRQVLDSYNDRMMVGEIYMEIEKLVTYYGEHLDECHLPFNFHLILSPWQAPTIRQLIEKYEANLTGGRWPNWVLGNHDQHRVATRIGAHQIRVANMMLLTLRGTPTCYYGDELGMENVPIPPEFLQDPPAVNQPEIAHIVGRDPERTPMQWDASPNAGFAEAGVQTWLPVAADYQTRNVAQQDPAPASMLNFYRALTALRHAEPALHQGDYATITTSQDDVLAYRRSAPNSHNFVIVLNFSGNDLTLDLSHVASSATIAVATDMQRSGTVDLSQLVLHGNEGLALRL